MGFDTPTFTPIFAAAASPAGPHISWDNCVPLPHPPAERIQRARAAFRVAGGLCCLNSCGEVSDDHPDHQLFATFTGASPPARQATGASPIQLVDSVAKMPAFRAAHSAAIACKRSLLKFRCLHLYLEQTEPWCPSTQNSASWPRLMASGQSTQPQIVSSKPFRPVKAISHPHSPTHDAACVYEPFRGM